MPRRKLNLASVWGMLGSRQLSFVSLASLAALVVMWLIPFQLTGLSQNSLDAIANKWAPFRVAYALVLLTTIACTIPRLTRDVRRVRNWRRSIENVSARTPLTRLDTSLDDAQQALEREGFTVHRSDDAIAAVRRPSALLGGSIMHLAIIGIATGLALHTFTSVDSTFRLIEGESLGKSSGAPAAQRAIRATVSDATLERITPSYYKDVLLFNRLDATWRRADGREETFSLANPLWLDPFTYVSIQDFGFAPHFRLVSTTGEIIDDVVAAMSVFPPGNNDHTTLPISGARVSAIVYPDHGVRMGRDVSLSYNLKRPEALISVSRPSFLGETAVLGRGLVKPGASIDLRGPDSPYKSLDVVEIRRYGSFRVSRSYGIPVLALSAIALVLGLAARVLGRRTDVVIWDDGGSGLACDAHVDLEGRAAALEWVESLFGDGHTAGVPL